MPEDEREELKNKFIKQGEIAYNVWAMSSADQKCIFFLAGLIL